MDQSSRDGKVAASRVIDNMGVHVVIDVGIAWTVERGSNDELVAVSVAVGVVATDFVISVLYVDVPVSKQLLK